MDIAKTVPEVLAGCAAGFVPVNVAIDIAIEAHQRASSANTLYVVILARQPTVMDSQRQLDYLARLPHTAWKDVPEWEEHRAVTLETIRRSIAWRTARNI